VAHKDQYDTDSRETNAAFFVAVDEAGVTYGLRVGKPDGKVKAGWPWAILVAALAENDQVRQDMRRVMLERELALEVYAEEKSYGRVGQIVVDGEQFVWRHETAEQEMTRQMDWDELVSYLQDVAPINRSDLFWRKHLSPQEAMDLGAGVVGQMVGMFEALLPLYASAGA
jgi:hypothetical protein